MLNRRTCGVYVPPGASLCVTMDTRETASRRRPTSSFSDVVSLNIWVYARSMRWKMVIACGMASAGATFVGARGTPASSLSTRLLMHSSMS